MEILNNLLRAGFGLLFIALVAVSISHARRKIQWRLVVIGFLLQIVLAFAILKVPFVRAIFRGVVNVFVYMIEATEESAQFMFGDLAIAGGPFGFAFYVLPTIVFFSALSALLYYLGVLQRIVYGFAWIMQRTMKLSGAESLAAAANVFIGQTEAPIVVKPYLEKMTRSEMMCLMTGGFATIAGGVFGAYISILGGETIEGKQLFGMHLLTASIISAPAAIVLAKMIWPETGQVNETMDVPRTSAGSNTLDALARGTTDGVKLAVNVGAMLLSFMAFIFLANKLLDVVGDWTNVNDTIAAASNGIYDGLSLQYLLGLVFAPVAWLLGVPTVDITYVGQMLGEKTILNEFFAYVTLGENKGLLQDKSVIIATYALCGFANFASIGIQIGGISVLAPGQRRTITELGIRAMIGGTLACFMTAIIASLLITEI